MAVLSWSFDEGSKQVPALPWERPLREAQIRVPHGSPGERWLAEMLEAALGLTEHVLHTPSVRINYAEGGAGKRPLILLHGLTLNLEAMGEIVIALSEVGCCYACDLRGHGKSDWSDIGYSVADHADDISALVAEVCGERSVVVGYSIGGLIALVVATRLPELVDGVVIIEPPLMLRNASFDTLRGSGQHGWIHWVHDLNSGRLTPSQAVARFREWQPDASEPDARQAMVNVSSVDPRMTQVLLEDRLYDGFDLEQTLRALTCPALLLVGETHLGGMASADDVDFFCSNALKGRAVRVQGGHDLIWGEPGATVSAEIIQFLQSIPG